ncbi:MAG: DUF4924 family protein [Bacteroidaceae bacterium]|nr:DUF4924 family protein [Bacteroidaceae bacterium]
MFVQRELREKNIAEYLLYMWQVEDTVRAAGLDSDRLYDTVIKGSGRSDAECIEWKQWYDDLIGMMRSEGKTVSGHLQVNENVLILLEDLHQRLLDSDRQQAYRELFYKALPFIVEFRARIHSTSGGELRDCFNMLYGVWMLRLQGKPVNPATEQAVKAVSAFIGKLAVLYREDKDGTLELY